MGETAELIIRNGVVVTASDIFRADLTVAGGRIKAVGEIPESLTHSGSCDVLDAEGLLVIPGGIDPHVHLHYPQGPNRVVSSDDWLTGTIAAACGGTTTLIDFVEAGPDQSWMEAFRERLADAEGQAVVDYAFHMSFNRTDDRSLAEMGTVVEAGMNSFKIYMAYDGIRLTDAQMLVALEALKAENCLPIVHAENHDVIMYLVARRLAAGQNEPRWHPFTRPAVGEVEATQRALALAEITGIPMHIVHVSTIRGTQIIERFKQRGLPVSGEVCPQHLILTDALYEQPGFDAAKYVMAPPLRKVEDNEGLWEGLQLGLLDFVVTDHCPFTLAQKRGERRTPEFCRLPSGTVDASPEAAWSNGLPPFNQIPGGAPGVETRLPLIYQFGVKQGRLSLNEFVNVTSTAAAKLYGLYPRKGTIAPGADADLVLLDPDLEVTVTADGLHQNCDYTPFEGLRVAGWPRAVISRGQLIVRDGQFAGSVGRGEYISRPV